MSIINDALKKAGQPIISETHRSAGRSYVEQNPEKRTDTKQTLRIERRKSTPNWGPFFLVGVLLLVTGPIVAPIFFNNPSSKIISAPTDLASSPISLSATPRGQYAVEEMPLNQTVMQTAHLERSADPKKKFKLSGVVYSEAGSYCLINGKVTTQGESVGDATVVKITANEVILNYQGETIALPVEV